MYLYIYVAVCLSVHLSNQSSYYFLTYDSHHRKDILAVTWLLSQYITLFGQPSQPFFCPLDFRVSSYEQKAINKFTLKLILRHFSNLISFCSEKEWSYIYSFKIVVNYKSKYKKSNCSELLICLNHYTRHVTYMILFNLNMSGYHCNLHFTGKENEVLSI